MVGLVYSMYSLLWLAIYIGFALANPVIRRMYGVEIHMDGNIYPAKAKAKKPKRIATTEYPVYFRDDASSSWQLWCYMDDKESQYNAVRALRTLYGGLRDFAYNRSDGVTKAEPCKLSYPPASPGTARYSYTYTYKPRPTPQNYAEELREEAIAQWEEMWTIRLHMEHLEEREGGPK